MRFIMAYRIGEECVGCGTCAANCPVPCIEVGTPYKIDETACIDCGTCAENCPVGCIAKAED